MPLMASSVIENKEAQARAGTYVAARAHGRRIQSALVGYVRASWYNVADTKAIATQVTRAQKNSTSGDVPGARDRWTTSPTAQTTNAYITRRTDRFAGPRGFSPKTD